MERVCIFVPGFLGSDLHVGASELGQANKLWLGIATFAGGGYRLLNMDNPIINAVGLNIVAQSPFLPVYEDFLQWLKGYFDRVDSHPYDWRLSLDASSAGLGFRIRNEISAGNTVTLIGHSAGGKLAALACSGLFPGELRQFRQLITIGTPWRGSFRAPEAMLGRGESMAIATALAAAGTFSFSRIERYRLQSALSSWPGTYELFPDDMLLVSTANGAYPSVWDPAKWDGIAQPLNAGKLAAGHAFTARNVRPPPEVTWMCYYGIGTPTPGPFRGDGDLLDAELRYDLDGDGVVSVQSGSVDRTNAGFNLPVIGEHGRLCSASSTLGALAPFL